MNYTAKVLAVLAIVAADPGGEVHTQVVEEGFKSPPGITHERVREHDVWGSPEQAASDESGFTWTQAGHAPTYIGSTLEAIGSIDEDLLQIDDELKSNMINRHREHTSTLAAMDSTFPGLQMGLDNYHGDVLVGSDSVSSGDSELMPQPTKIEATISEQLFSTIHTQNVLRARGHNVNDETVGAEEGKEMVSTDYLQTLSASGTSSKQEYRNPMIRKRAHREPMKANQQPSISSNEYIYMQGAATASQQGEHENKLTRRRKHDADLQLDSNNPSISVILTLSKDFGPKRTTATTTDSINSEKSEITVKQITSKSKPPSTAPSVSDNPSTSTTPSQSPSESGMPSLTSHPSESPSTSAQPSRSGVPSSQPSVPPSLSGGPSFVPSQSPSGSGMPSLTSHPSGPFLTRPSFRPSTSRMPSSAPSALPSTDPSESPTVSSQPSLSITPSSQPSCSPSVSVEPSSSPSIFPTMTIWP